MAFDLQLILRGGIAGSPQSSCLATIPERIAGRPLSDVLRAPGRESPRPPATNALTPQRSASSCLAERQVHSGWIRARAIGIARHRYDKRTKWLCTKPAPSSNRPRISGRRRQRVALQRERASAGPNTCIRNERIECELFTAGDAAGRERFPSDKSGVRTERNARRLTEARAGERNDRHRVNIPALRLLPTRMEVHSRATRAPGGDDRFALRRLT